MTERKPELIVAGLLEQDGKFMLVKEKMSDDRHYWIVPGGHVRFGEDLRQALKREIKEETHLDIQIKELINFKEVINTERDYHTLVFFFRAKPVGGEIMADDGVLDAQFFSGDELKELNLIESARWLLQDNLGIF